MPELFEDVIVRTIARLMTPFIQLFALYVLMHGHATPGGGFQAGVIIAASFILVAIALGLEEAKDRVKQKVRLPMESFGPLNFVVVGVVCMICGGYYLQYTIVPLLPSLQAVGAVLISAVEVGIGVTVMAMVTTIFFSMAGGKHDTS
ncbi:MAG: MnhB domain-containing protein [Methanocellales archaeon]|nr:MnhB domain-containing protein [Methanocellales archaeon]